MLKRLTAVVFFTGSKSVFENTLFACRRIVKVLQPRTEIVNRYCTGVCYENLQKI